MTERKWADSTPTVPFGGLHGSGNDKTQFQRIVELERTLAAREEELVAMKQRAEAAERRAEEAQRDAARMEFLHERCSVSLHFKRPDGTEAWLHGPSDLRAAIDAAIAAKGEA